MLASTHQEALELQRDRQRPVAEVPHWVIDLGDLFTTTRCNLPRGPIDADHVTFSRPF